MYTYFNKGLIKMNKSYKTILGVLASLLLLMIVVELHYQSYLQKKGIENSFVEVKQELSINYLNGKKINSGEKKKTISFSVTNLSTEDLTYFIELVDVTGKSEGITYTITKDNELLKDKTSLSFTSLANDVTIEKGKTHRYTMNIENSESSLFGFELNINTVAFDNSFASEILRNNQVQDSNNSYEIASSLNGLIHKKEETGDVYFFRGNVSNNYVSFANNNWRIVKINEDRSVKLILDGITENLEPINDSSMVGNTNYETTHVNNSLLEWYNLQLKEYDRYIASTIYCYDDSVLSDIDGVVEYLPSNRLFVDKLPTYSCSGSNISTKIALLNADEAMFAGIKDTSNESFLHLDSLQSSWWTMTPSKKNIDEVFYMAINKDGVLENTVSEKNNLFIRPVITLNAKTNVVGEGTKENPYQVSQD